MTRSGSPSSLTSGPAPRVGLACLLPCLLLLADPARPGIAPPDETRVPPPDERILRIGRDARYLVTLPSHLDDRGKRDLGLVAGGTVLLYCFRDGIRREVQDRRSPGRDRFLENVRTMGKGAFAPALALTAYLSSFGTHDQRERETAVLLLESAAFSSVAAGVGSYVLAAERPRDGNDIRVLDKDGHGVSLDAALAASVVNPLRRQYLLLRDEDGPWRRFLKRGATVLLYTGAALTAYERLNVDAHWAPDAFLGTMTGLGVGNALCDAHGVPRTRRGGTPAAARLRFGPRSVTLTIPVGRDARSAAQARSGRR